MQPPVGRERRRRHRRPLHQDLLVGGDLARACRIAAAPPPARPPPIAAARRRRDLRAGLGQAVGQADRHARLARPVDQRRGHRAATGERAAQRPSGCEGRASSSRASVVATRLTSVTVLLAQGREHALGIEALVHDRRGGVDGRANEDRQPADVRQRQRAQPALARVAAERHGRAERAPQEVAIGQLDRPSARRWCRRCGSLRRSRRDRARPRAASLAAAADRARRHRSGAPPGSPPPRRRAAARSAGEARGSIGTAIAPSRQAGVQRLGERRGPQAARSRPGLLEPRRARELRRAGSRGRSSSA